MTNEKTIEKYLSVLYAWKNEADKRQVINIKNLIGKIGASHAIAAAAIKGGYFVKNGIMRYKCNVDHFTRADVKRIIGIMRDDNMKSRRKHDHVTECVDSLLTPSGLAAKYSIEELAEALKIKGCSAVIEMKQTISF